METYLDHVGSLLLKLDELLDEPQVMAAINERPDATEFMASLQESVKILGCVLELESIAEDVSEAAFTFRAALETNLGRIEA